MIIAQIVRLLFYVEIFELLKNIYRIQIYDHDIEISQEEKIEH